VCTIRYIIPVCVNRFCQSPPTLQQHLQCHQLAHSNDHSGRGTQRLMDANELIIHCEQRHATECAWFSVLTGGSLMPCWILVRGTCTASRPLRWSGIAMIDNSSNPYGDAISQKTHFNPLCHTAPRRGGSSGACRLRLQSGLSPGRPPQLANAGGLVRQSQPRLWCLRQTFAKIVPALLCLSQYIIRGTRSGTRELLLSFPRALVHYRVLEQCPHRVLEEKIFLA
jgi:hypothetical protein